MLVVTGKLYELPAFMKALRKGFSPLPRAGVAGSLARISDTRGKLISTW